MARQNILIRSKRKRAIALVEAQRLPEAAAALEQVSRLDPRDSEIWNLLGAVNGLLGKTDVAVECLRKAVALQPGHAQAHYNLGVALRDCGDLATAAREFGEALRLQPDHPTAYDSLAHVLVALGRMEEAANVLRRALQLQPTKPELHVNLGATYQAQCLLGKAVDCYREAQRLRPGQPLAHENLGSALTAQGRFDEAFACYREGLRMSPQDARTHSNILLTLNYLSDQDRLDVLAEHRAWGEAHGAARRPGSYPNTRDPDRRLRVGYVSPDFREHSVAYYIEPVLARHDRNKVVVHCYSDMPRPDATTARLRALADVWHDTNGLTDDQLSELVRSDGIDILVDLAGHTASGRLRTLARKPAPVQVTYLGYPNTTGLDAIGYRLTDGLADPSGSDAFYTETLVRLPGSFLCYQHPGDAPPVARPPAERAGHVTFGSFNNLAKISPGVISAWSRILSVSPGSRLLVKNPSLTDTETRERYYELFKCEGADPDRIELIGHMPTRAEHLALYGRVDIALDTFPYNGTTTTCEALWMGVPVVALAGEVHAARVGLSLLTALGHPEWVAGSLEDYVAIAATLAADKDRLGRLRSGLRAEMAASALCDAGAFVGGLEAAYRSMWHRWCAETE